MRQELADYIENYMKRFPKSEAVREEYSILEKG